MRTQEAERAYRQAYYLAHREQLKAAARARYWDDPDRHRAAGRAYQEAHKAQIAAYKKAAYLAQRTERIEKQKIYNDQNKASVSAYKKEWSAKNREKITAKKAAKYQEQCTEIRVKQAATYAANPEPARARAKAYRLANPSKARATHQKWVELNRDRVRRVKRVAEQRRRAICPEKFAAYRSLRRARERGSRAEARIDYKSILRASNGLCGICNKPLDLLGTHFDHIVPIARGGEHTAGNIQATHARCNLKKGSRSVRSVSKEVVIWQ